MSNIHEVDIRGIMPFHIYEHEGAKGWLGLMNCPTIGIRISYYGHEYVPNERGGKTAMYSFVIDGSEAMRFEALKKMVSDFKEAGCTLSIACARDIENQTPFYSLE